MPRHQALLDQLADGRTRSGESLGGRLGISRAAVWKLVSRLRDLGVPVRSVPGSGYRLTSPVVLLDSIAIRRELPAELRAFIADVAVELSVDSTNARLRARSGRGLRRPTVLLAECQMAGEGRRGRTWHSAFGASLCMSVAWPCRELRGSLSGLSLVAGLAVARAVERVVGMSPGLKWPNDLVHGDRKLGGILLEVNGEPQGPCCVIIGIGVNCDLGDGHADIDIDQPWTDLCRMSGRSVDRNQLAAAVIEALAARLPLFSEQGFAPFRPEWNRLDALAGRKALLSTGGDAHVGTVRGVDDAGALLFDNENGISPWYSGEVSVRIAP